MKTLVCVEKHYTLKLSSHDIIEALRARGFDVPTDADVMVHGPSEGDDGHTLDIAACPLLVTWTVKCAEGIGHE